jgi:hypothetical protein
LKYFQPAAVMSSRQSKVSANANPTPRCQCGRAAKGRCFLCE